MGSRRLVALQDAGIEFVAGVPCPSLRTFFAACRELPPTSYLEAVREDQAVAACAGAWLGGRRTVAVMSAAGLGRCLHILSAFKAGFRLPLAVLVGDRVGVDSGLEDASHWRQLLDLLEIPWREASAGDEAGDAAWLISTAEERHRPAVLALETSDDS